MPETGIVCDSTCDLGPAWLEEHGARMVPLAVYFGDEEYRDWVDLTPDEFYTKLEGSQVLPRTSQPSPSDFTAAYTELAGQGCSQIVSIHLSAKVSGTVQSATIAADESPVPARIVDTRLVSQATALVLRAALDARDAGSSADEIERVAAETSAATRLFFVLDTLEYLVKGGRAGKAQGLAASMLNIKPILTFTPEGEVGPYKRVRGQRGALQELADFVAQDTAARGRMRASFLYANDASLPERLGAALLEAGAELDIVSTGHVGAVIGTYAGPRAVGIAYHPVR
jgi:DegV family protein with EDD domain